MTTVDVTFDVQSGDLNQKLIALEVLLNPVGLSGFLQTQVGPYLQKRAKERFASEGDDVSGKWLPLTPATEAIRASQQYPPAHPINVRSGELERWVTGNSWVSTPNALGSTLRYPANAPTGELKTKVETAQRGKPSPRTPARPVLGVNENDLIFVLAALHFNIEQVIR